MCLRDCSNMRYLRTIFFLLLLPVAGWAQFKRVPLIQPGKIEKKHSNARVQSLSAMELPFWDDFSYSQTRYYTNDSLWVYSHSAGLSSGIGINPPTLNVAFFDGLDSLGKPYSVNDATAKGYADKMTSRPLRTDLITGSRQDSVFIYFMYQYQGHGEAPDPGDSFSLWLKDADGIWNNVWSVTQETTSNANVFVPVTIPVNDPKYFHDHFQFEFRSFGRLSGPFDGWNLDYVYMSNGRKQYTPIYSDFPDRAITFPVSSLFKQYRAIPAKHFLENPTQRLTHPIIVAGNRRQDQTTGQPINYDSHVTITTRKSKVITKGKRTLLDSAAGSTLVKYNINDTLTLNTLPDVTGIDAQSDSIGIKLEVKINSGDNEVKVGTIKGDFDPFVYANLDFRSNDTTSTRFILHNYYAYDDGAAEYAASLTNPGNKIVYRYDLNYSQQDTLVAVDIYFTHSGDESSQVVKLLVMDTLIQDVTQKFFPQDVVVNRTENNKFTRIPLGNAVLVKDHFYIGWVQNTNAIIGVGLDYSSDSGNKMFVNFTGDWEPNGDVHGNLMLRPVFGNGTLGATTAVVPEKAIHSYPNPSKGRFTIPAEASAVLITDLAGREVFFEQENEVNQTTVHLSSNASGFYVLRYLVANQWHTEKIMVYPQ